MTRLKQLLKSRVMGSQLLYWPELDSTNRVARDLAPNEWGHGTVVLTDAQHAGRGRLGRQWMSPRASSLLFSLILVLDRDEIAPDLIMVSALSIRDTLSRYGLQPELKWPNDVLIGGRKVCGILAENSPQGDQRRLIIGVGLNVNFDPCSISGLGDFATSLQNEVGHQVEREPLMMELLNSFEVWYRIVTREPLDVFAEWSAEVCVVGRSILVTEAAGAWPGTMSKVQRDGALVVRDQTGKDRIVYAGDVSIRPARQGGTSAHLGDAESHIVQPTHERK